MRPFIDINNLSFSKETLIYYSRSLIFLWIFILIGMTIGSIYALQIENGFILSLLLFAFIIFQGNEQFKLLKRINEVQFRINSKGIQYRDEILVSWNNIENERVVIEGRPKARRNFFIYYIIDQDKVMKFDIEELNVGAGDLEHTLTIHRNRYKRENNIK
ncbi:hypothetical protein IRZ71_20845 [Flavobacterium sp. ANB]|uniref:hypothetical protein n=1 Tax=unclassified Flavobacterium TaxID=196869 RepID=UPI0012B7A6C1|nr:MULTISPECIES: hypothetical protein [unclassified Flavobacterium]MBF4518811.1 hypothetical protein [Flavobacterium sp. ANB]MTD71476.1 hypothetical protein [Flavobacterium sp. LC2016-13]